MYVFTMLILWGIGDLVTLTWYKVSVKNILNALFQDCRVYEVFNNYLCLVNVALCMNMIDAF